MRTHTAIPRLRTVAVVAKYFIAILWPTLRFEVNGDPAAASVYGLPMCSSASVDVLKCQKLWVRLSAAGATPAICANHFSAKIVSARLTCCKRPLSIGFIPLSAPIPDFLLSLVCLACPPSTLPLSKARKVRHPTLFTAPLHLLSISQIGGVQAITLALLGLRRLCLTDRSLTRKANPFKAVASTRKITDCGRVLGQASGTFGAVHPRKIARVSRMFTRDFRCSISWTVWGNQTTKFSEVAA